MKLKQPTSGYARRDETERNRTIERSDALNHKKNQDIQVGPARLVVSSADGTRYEIDVANGGAVIVRDMDGVRVENSGVGTLDFGTGANSAEQTITGVESITADSVVLCDMRIEATTDHPVDDLLIDPIRVEAYDIVAGTGFTLYGAMGNANANGLYRVNWSVL
ncbi:hypothetical protein DB2_14 [Octadecabacter Antarctic DB virus 2]|nr:hypothetical protein DB2_14 [Octadecabacter Antarctic DB virus 2]